MSHLHGFTPDPDDERNCLEIDPHVCLQPTGVYGQPDDVLAGFLMWHDRDGVVGRCGGGVAVRDNGDGRARWQMTGSLEGGDLTLSPSILCRTPFDGRECGFHGFVRDGQWVPA